MGILKETGKGINNILTKYDFEYEQRSVTGALNNCYEKVIPLGLYSAWISVKTSGEVFIYIEYDCGGEVASYDNVINANWNESEVAFFDELDEYVTNILENYKD